MFNWRDLLLVGALVCLADARAQPAAYPGIGRAATPAEIKAWDIDVRPDFKGLPKGSGSVAQGMEVWEAKCASCHGVFGESNEVFSPIVGGTTKDDIQTGHVARLNDPAFPGRTTLMKLSTVSTLWDYIQRAMPWTAPKSLSVNEVYAVTAYVLNLGGVVADDYTLSEQNIGEVQQRLPNRHGVTTEHALWPGDAFGRRPPDVRAVACMKDCGAEPRIGSSLPEFARNAHGNLADQNRSVGAQRGATTSRPPAQPATVPAPAASTHAAAATVLLQTHNCTACHGIDNRIVGPALRDVSRKYAGRADAAEYLAGKIKAGGSGLWGAIPMPAQTLSDADAKVIARWLAE